MLPRPECYARKGFMLCYKACQKISKDTVEYKNIMEGNAFKYTLLQNNIRSKNLSYNHETQHECRLERDM